MTKRALALVFAVALLARALHLVLIGDTPLYRLPHGDGAAYLAWADRIRADGVLEGESAWYQAPLYPYVLAALRGLFGESLAVVRGAQALLGAGTATLVAAATARAFDRRAGLAAGLLVALLPTSIWLDGLVQKSALSGLLVALVFVCATGEGTRARLGLGVAVGLLMLTRGEARLAALLVGGWLGVRREGRALALYTGGLALVLLPALARNVAVAGEWTLTTAQAGPNLWIGNAPDSAGTYVPLVVGRGDARYEREDAERLAREGLGLAPEAPLTASAVSRYWRDRTFDAVQGDPAAAARRLVHKARLALGDGEIPDTDDLEHARRDSWVVRPPVGFGLVFVLAAIGLVALRPEERRRGAPFLVVAVAQFAALVLFYVVARYRLPLTLALVPFAGVGITRLAGWRVRARDAWILAALVVTVTAPIDTEVGRAAALANEAQALAELDRDTEAEERAREALAIVPDLFPAQKALGRALMAQGRSADALPVLEAAVAEAPDDWSLGAWLGIAHGENGNHARALELLADRALERPEALPIVSNAMGLAVAARNDALSVALAEARLAAEPVDSAAPFRLQLAWILATSPAAALRDGARAVELVAALGDDPAVLGVRAAALAENGQFDEAGAVLRTALTALDAANVPSGDPARQRLEAQRAAFARGEAWRE